MGELARILRRLRLRYLLFFLLLFSGLVPLGVSTLLLLRQNREILETQEKSYLTRSAQFLSVELNQYLGATRHQLTQLADLLQAAAPGVSVDRKLRQPWLAGYLREFLARNPSLVAIRILNADGAGPYSAAAGLPAELLLILNDAFSQVVAEGQPVYRFWVRPETEEPMAILAVPAAVPAGEPVLFIEAVARLRQMERVFRQEARGDTSVFLIDRGGELLWWGSASTEMQQALRRSELVQDFVASPLNMTQEYSIEIDGRRQRMLGRVSAVEETGWGVVVHRPAAVAFAAVREMVFNTALSTAVLVALALVIAVLAAQRFSQPIQQLAETTAQIAAGNFGRRVEALGPGKELNDLASDFNRMSGYVQDYVEKLGRAARENQELFIGSMRSFVAAIDAKDPYTRGHSERVATYARTISKYLGVSEEMQHWVWVGAVLHDVGKIGIDDRILTKGGVLTDEEYEQMKLHPTIGAEIMSRIEQLREMIPAIRWHHEAWNGKGYPDGLKGEQIPLMARIVSVADTFDAITTSRRYQRAYEPQFAVETIEKLAGSRFDAKVVTAFRRAFKAGQIKKRTPPAPAPLVATVAGAAASS